MTTDIILQEVENRVLTITLNRPDKRNAFSPELISALTDVFSKANDDDDIKIIILKGAGKAFSAGADLSYLQDLQSNTFEENVADSTLLKNLFALMYQHKKVIIAQVEGFALAGGCGLATVCDFCFATPESQFGYTEVKIGFIPAIVMFFLLRKIGEGKSKELLISGKVIDAQKAHQLGLINDIISADAINGYVQDFAQKLCVEASSQALTMTKQMIASIQAMDMEEGLNYAAHQNATARATEDCKAGIQAFLDKQKISW